MLGRPWEGLLPAPATTVGDGTGAAFGRLGTAYVQRIGDPERVTSVVVAHAPGPELLASVRSLAAQSWTNHEILVLDDCSPHGHDPVFRAAAALDPRVRVLRLPATTPAGRYAARNAGLDAATGAYVTFQEPGTWSHPARLARQVAVLRSRKVPGICCRALIVSPDLATIGDKVRGPLMIRAGADRFDPVCHGGEDEFVERLDIRTVDDVLSLKLPATADAPASALRAYRSAYRAWHRRSRTAPPPGPRPWPVLHRRGRRAYDVVIAADWTRPDAGLGQLRALKARDLRVALLHLDDPARPADDLDAPVQDAVNDGEADQIDPADDVRSRLVVVRDPRLLRTPRAGGLRATRVVLEAALAGDQPLPAGPVFGVEPLWAPPGPHARAALAELPLTDVDVPGTVGAGEWRLDRRLPRPGRPVIGRQCTGGRDEWRKLCAELPEHPQIDVRLRNGSGRRPGWLNYGEAELSLRCFLHQVDFYLPLPGDDSPADTDTGVLAAMAAGCVVVLPPRYAPAYGDAAVYSTVPDLTQTVRDLHARPASLVRQRDRGREFVLANHHHERWAERILALTP